MRNDQEHKFPERLIKYLGGGDMKVKDLCLALAQADREDQVISLLDSVGYWDNPDVWRYYGNNENNFSIIGNQASGADLALVEKIINSECSEFAIEWLKCNGFIEVWGWRKLKLKRGGKAMRWVPRIKEITLGDFRQDCF